MEASDGATCETGNGSTTAANLESKTNGDASCDNAKEHKGEADSNDVTLTDKVSDQATIFTNSESGESNEGGSSSVALPENTEEPKNGKLTKNVIILEENESIDAMAYPDFVYFSNKETVNGNDSAKETKISEKPYKSASGNTKQGETDSKNLLLKYSKSVSANSERSAHQTGNLQQRSYPSSLNQAEINQRSIHNNLPLIDSATVSENKGKAESNDETVSEKVSNRSTVSTNNDSGGNNEIRCINFGENNIEVKFSGIGNKVHPFAKRYPAVTTENSGLENKNELHTPRVNNDEHKNNSQMCQLPANHDGVEKHSENTPATKPETNNNNGAETTKLFLEEIRNLNSKNEHLTVTLENQKYIYGHMVNTIEALYQKLEQPKTTIGGSVWNGFFGRGKSGDDNISNVIKKIEDYIEILHKDQNKQESVILQKIEENDSLQHQLKYLKNKFELELKQQTEVIEQQKTEIAKLKISNNTVEQKRKDQVEITNKKHKQLEDLKIKSRTIEMQLKNQITDINSYFASQESGYETAIKNTSQENDILQEKLKNLKRAFEQDLRELTDKLNCTANLLHKKIAENSALKQEQHEYKAKALQIEKHLNVNIHSLQKENVEATMNNEILKSSLNQTRDELQNATKKLEAFARESEKCNKSLNTISKKIEGYTTKISLDDVKRKTETKIIDQAKDKIREIESSVKKYEDKINSFQGNSENKTYLDIKENLIRAVEKLDTIESQKKKEIQNHRKKAIEYIKELQDKLEARVDRK